MKNISVIVFCLFCADLVRAQTPLFPFPTENAYWHTSLGCIEPYYEDIYTCLDTMMDGVKYSQLYTSFYFINGPDPGTFAGGLRSEGNKVWLKPESGSDELLLYDFSAAVGDTVHLWRHFLAFANTSIDTVQLVDFKVTKIDSILLDDGWHKRWKAACINDFYGFETWIEGVGATYGPFDRYICAIFSNVAKVTCLWHNGQTRYAAFPGTSCDNFGYAECLVPVGTTQPDLMDISVFPNPFSDFLYLSFAEEMPPVANIRMFDMLGKEVETQQQNTGNTIAIECRKLPRGMYFLKVENTAKPGFFQIVKVVAN